MKFTLSIVTYLLLIIILTNLKLEQEIIIVVALTLIMLIALVLGASDIKLNFFIKSLCHLKSNNREIAITFDDGPNERYTPQILKILAKHNAKATFFCIGTNIESNADIVKQIINEGHSIGNHSYEHSFWFPFWSTKKIGESIQKTDKSLYNVAKTRTKIFRPPFGVINNLIASAIKKNGKTSIGWSIRTKDTCRQASKVIALLEKKIKENSIILLHDNHSGCTEILEQLLIHCKKNNYKPIALKNN